MFLFNINVSSRKFDFSDGRVSLNELGTAGTDCYQGICLLHTQHKLVCITLRQWSSTTVASVDLIFKGAEHSRFPLEFERVPGLLKITSYMKTKQCVTVRMSPGPLFPLRFHSPDTKDSQPSHLQSPVLTYLQCIESVPSSCPTHSRDSEARGCLAGRPAG